MTISHPASSVAHAHHLHHHALWLDVNWQVICRIEISHRCIGVLLLISCKVNRFLQICKIKNRKAQESRARPAESVVEKDMENAYGEIRQHGT